MARRTHASGLPLPQPMLVAGDSEFDAFVRAARADLAKLSLELRALRHEAAAAQGASGLDGAADGLDLHAARELLHAGLDARLATRRRELLAEVDLAHAAAARRIVAAESEAAALVASARQELLQALSDTRAHQGPPLPPPPAPGPAAIWAQPPPPPAPHAPPAPPAPAAAEPVPTPPGTTGRRPDRSFRAQFLHADVVLPLVAVVIVVVVLLAWLA